MSAFDKASKKEAGIGHVLLFQLRNTIGRLMETYLYRPVEIVTRGRLNITSRYLWVLNNISPAS